MMDNKTSKIKVGKVHRSALLTCAIMYTSESEDNMKDIVKATDLFMAGFFMFTIYSGLMSPATGGQILFYYLVIRFILKRITK